MSETAKEKIAERVADLAPGMVAAARAMALQDHRRTLNSYQKRVNDSHRMQAKALGMEDVVSDSPEDDMGDIIVTGDIHYIGASAPQLPWSKEQPQQPQQPSQEPTPHPEPEDESLLSKIAKPAAIAAGTMAAGGIGAAAVNALWPDDPPPVVQPAPERPMIELPTVPQAEDGRIRVEVRPYQPEG